MGAWSSTTRKGEEITFMDLPGEMRETIYGYLRPKDLMNLRKTCHDMRNEIDAFMPRHKSLTISRDAMILSYGLGEEAKRAFLDIFALKHKPLTFYQTAFITELREVAEQKFGFKHRTFPELGPYDIEYLEAVFKGTGKYPLITNAISITKKDGHDVKLTVPKSDEIFNAITNCEVMLKFQSKAAEIQKNLRRMTNLRELKMVTDVDTLDRVAIPISVTKLFLVQNRFGNAMGPRNAEMARGVRHLLIAANLPADYKVFESVEKLELINIKDFNQVVEFIKHFTSRPSLRELRFTQQSKINPAMLYLGEQAHDLSRIKTLTIDFDTKKSDDIEFARLFIDLERLVIKRFQFTKTCPQIFQYANLLHLEFTFTISKGYGDERLNALTPNQRIESISAGCPRLRFLAMSFECKDGVEDLEISLADFPTLRELIIHSERTTMLVETGNMPLLRELTLGTFKPKAQAEQFKFNAPLPSLRKLAINSIIPIGYEVLSLNDYIPEFTVIYYGLIAEFDNKAHVERYVKGRFPGHKVLYQKPRAKIKYTSLVNSSPGDD